MTDIVTGRRIEAAIGFVIGTVGLLCLALSTWLAMMMILHRTVSVPAFAVLGISILLTCFFLNVAWKVVSHRPGRVLSTFTLYLLATLFFALASVFAFMGFWKREPSYIIPILSSVLLLSWCISAERMLKRKGNGDDR